MVSLRLIFPDQLSKNNAAFKDIQDNERKLVEELNEKYGPGQLDPQTGVFTPAPPQEEAAEEVEQS